MYVIIACKYEKDPIKNNREKVATPTLSVAMELSSRFWPNFELIQAFMHVLIACKYEKDQMKNSGENVMTSFEPRHEKTNVLHMRKQRRRSAAQ